MIIQEDDVGRSRILIVKCGLEWSRREKLRLGLELQKHQSEPFVFKREKLKRKGWTPVEIEESKRILGSDRKMISEQ